MTALFVGSRHGPRVQTYFLLFACLQEVVAEFMLRPIIPFMIRMLSSDLPKNEIEAAIGIRSGLLNGVFWLPNVLCNLGWGAASDRMGRKPILLMGLFFGGLTTFIVGANTSSFVLALACRFIAGCFGANSTVAKGSLGLIHQDEESRAWGYTMHGLLYAFSGIAGPVLGGLLVRNRDEADKPSGVSPYLGVGVFCAVLGAVGCYTTVHYLRELRKSNVDSEFISRPEAVLFSDDNASAAASGTLEIFQSPKLLLAIACYTLISFCTMTWANLFPLLFSTPIELGGLGLTVQETSFAMSIPHSVRLVFQLVALQFVVVRLGPLRAYCLGMLAILPVTFGMGLLGGSAQTPWFWITVWLSLSGLIESTVFLTTMMLICESAPPSALGAAFGLSATFASVANAVAPPLAGWAWTFAAMNIRLPFLAFAIMQGVALTGVAVAVWGYGRGSGITDTESTRLMDN